MTTSDRDSYEKPVLRKLDNIKRITLDCPDFQCSILIPPPPPSGN